MFYYGKMNMVGRNYLTAEEWEYVKELANNNFPDYDPDNNWEKVGHGNYEKFDFVRSSQIETVD